MDLMSSTSPSRPFTVLDALALVAATAIGMAPGRSVWAKMIRQWPGLASPAIGDYSTELVYLSLPCLAMLTLTLIALHLRHSGPSPAHLMQRPGISTDCIVASVSLAIGGLVLAVRLGKGLISFGRQFPMRQDRGLFLVESLSVLSIVVGLTVLASWVSQILGRRLAAGSQLDRPGGAGPRRFMDRGRVDERLAQSPPSRPLSKPSPGASQPPG